MKEEITNIFEKIKKKFITYNSEFKISNLENVPIFKQSITINLKKIIVLENYDFNILDKILNDTTKNILISDLEDKIKIFENILTIHINNLETKLLDDNILITNENISNEISNFEAEVSKLENLNTTNILNEYLNIISNELNIEKNSKLYLDIKNIIYKELRIISKAFQNNKKKILNDILNNDFLNIKDFFDEYIKQENLKNNTTEEIIESDDILKEEIDTSLKYQLAKDGILNMKLFFDKEITQYLNQKKELIINNFRTLRNNLNKFLEENNLSELSYFHYMYVADEYDIIFNTNILQKLATESNLSFKETLNSSNINVDELTISKNSNIVLVEFTNSISHLFNLIYKDILLDKKIEDNVLLSSQLQEIIDDIKNDFIKKINFIYKNICNKTYDKINNETNLELKKSLKYLN